MSTQIRLLGKPQVAVDGQPSPVLKSAKGLALLAYLVITRQAHSREAIADLLWEATSTAKSLNNLRQLLSRLKKWLPDLQISAAEVAYEANDFVDLYVMSEGLTAVSPHMLDEALQLYTGDLLANFYVPDTPRFNEWLLLEREQLRQRITVAYRQLCDTYAEQEDWVRGVTAAQRWLLLDELNETALPYLLQFLAATGQIEVALQQYEITKQQLWLELAVEPEPETVQLVQRLQRLKEQQGGGVSWAAIVGAQMERPSADELAEPGSLPINAYVPYQRNNDFTGRKESLLHLAHLLLPDAGQPTHRAVAVTGMGGLGKTQTAVEFCYRYGRFFPGGVFWLSFADGDNVAAEISLIGGERGMNLYRDDEKHSQASRINQVQRAWQEPTPRLLIFDNCEEEALLQKWLPVTGGCRVLLTSRRGKWARDLQVSTWPLPALDPHESEALLHQLVPHISQEAAAEIATEVGHLPLALHLAGGFLRRYRQITPTQYLAQLRDKGLLSHPSLQGRGSQHSPTGHELNVARTFAVNWEQLDTTDETDVMALHLLTHAVQFAPGEPLPRELLLSTLLAADADVAQMLLVEDGLARLIALGFIKDDGENTVTLHRLVIAFVQTMLTEQTEAVTAVVQTVWQRIKAHWDAGFYLDRLPVPLVHIRHIMEAEQIRATPYAVRLTHAWGRHLMDIGDLTTSRTFLESAWQLSQQTAELEPAETADILMSLGTIIWQTDTAESAYPHYQQAFTIYQQQYGDNHIKTARSLNNLAIIHSRTGNNQKAIAHYQHALTIFERILPPDNLDAARTLYNLGLSYRRLGSYMLALSHYEISLKIREKILSADHPSLLESVTGMGVINFLIGDYETALALHQRALAGRESRLGTVHPYTTVSLGNVGLCLSLLGEPERGLALIQQSLTNREAAYGPDHPQLVFTLTWLGYVWRMMDQTEQARRHLERALGIIEAHEMADETTADTLTFLASALQAVGDLFTARTYLDRAFKMWQQNQTDAHPKIAVPLISLGEWHEAQGAKVEALACYEKALAVLVNQVLATQVDLKRVREHLTRLQA
ncbi:MAG: tetratricopeptide repeat protein [Ardenticatenaceae bacterium]|nr:tetratricopeptide repeat protein [Ardenticatenaceae bacterium]